MSDGFKDFGASEGRPLMPLVWGIVLFAAGFEPLLLSDVLEKQLRAKGYLSLVVRGCVSGAIIFGVWACLYGLGQTYKSYTVILILLGYGLAVGIGILGMIIGDGRQKQTERTLTE
jgi:hypothetical protein